MCLDTKIILVKNSQGAFKIGDEAKIKIGDEAKIKIDLSNRQETASFLSGFLEGVDIPIIFSNTWMPHIMVSNSTSS